MTVSCVLILRLNMAWARQERIRTREAATYADAWKFRLRNVTDWAAYFVTIRQWGMSRSKEMFTLGIEMIRVRVKASQCA
jgi:hypothetical protein